RGVSSQVSELRERKIGITLLIAPVICGWRSPLGPSFGRAMVMTQAATAVTTTAPTAGPAIGVGLAYSMLWFQGCWQSRARAARGRRPCGGYSGLGNAGASQQGRRVGAGGA